MKKILFYLLTAVFTFIFSLGGVYVFNFFTQLPKVEISDEIFCPVGCNFLGNKIDIEYKYTVRGKEFNNGVFLVTNLTSNSISYVSYEKNHHADNWIKQNGKITTNLICHMGMSEQELKPFESAIFEIPVPKNRKPFEVGFDFYINGSLKPETTWVKINKQSIFVEKFAH